MQSDLDAEGLGDRVRILGVNRDNAAGSNALVTEGRALPWLQDAPPENVWSRWGVAYRDVILLDQDNRMVATYNLTQHDLGQVENYQTLKMLLMTHLEE